MPPSRPCPLYDGANYVVEDSMGHKLVSLVMQMRRAVDLRMAEHDLTDAQWKPLWFLNSGRATTAIELARELGVDAGAITRMLDRLEAKGLLARVRSQADRRVVHLELTPEGRAKAAEVPHVLASVNNDLLRGFTEADFKHLLKLVDRLSANATLMQTPTPEA